VEIDWQLANFQLPPYAWNVNETRCVRSATVDAGVFSTSQAAGTVRQRETNISPNMPERQDTTICVARAFGVKPQPSPSMQ
jgi:hypothetical protein